MKKIGFVIPWYGPDIPGGAEAALRGLAEHMADAGVDVEVLTTRVKEFGADWSRNYYPAGRTMVNNVPVVRFDVRERDSEGFDRVNFKFMQGLPVGYEEERIFLEEMVNSPALYEYLRVHKEEYAFYVFTPYMFGTTYYGIQAAPDKAVMIPCFHDESYAYMEHFKEVFSRVRGMIFLAGPEKVLAERLYDTAGVEKAVLGTGVYTDFTGDGERFRSKYHLDKPFILYAGRKDKGKNIYTLLAYYREYVHRHDTDVQLVLIGGGQIEIPEEIRSRVHDLGFVPVQDKYDACAAAEALCNPSHNESFSIVIMESWLCGRPVLVSGACAVTKDFVIQSGGGLYFDTFFEFEGALEYFGRHPDMAARMGQCGRDYVMGNFAWDTIVERYTEYFRQLSGG